jgi:PTS system nitrogen regulatory IIA component
MPECHRIGIASETMRISAYLRRDLIVPELEASTKVGALGELVAKMLPVRRDVDGESLLAVLMERESLGSTGIGKGIALPHALLDGLGEPFIIFGRSTAGIPFDSRDAMPVHLIVLIVADSGSLETYLKILARLSRLLKDVSLRKRLISAADGASLLEILVEQDSLF